MGSCFLLLCNIATCCTMLHEFLCVSFPILKSYTVVFFHFCSAGPSERAGRLADTAWWSQWATEGHPARIQPADECSTNSRGGQALGLGGEPISRVGVCFGIEHDKANLMRNCSSWHVLMLVALGKGLGRLGLLYNASRVTALLSTAQPWLCFLLQLFGRLIRKSWKACRDCLVITMSDWTSSSKNPTSWWQLIKRIGRTTVTCCIGTDSLHYLLYNVFLVARTWTVWVLRFWLYICIYL